MYVYMYNRLHGHLLLGTGTENGYQLLGTVTAWLQGTGYRYPLPGAGYQLLDTIIYRLPFTEYSIIGHWVQGTGYRYWLLITGYCNIQATEYSYYRALGTGTGYHIGYQLLSIVATGC